MYCRRTTCVMNTRTTKKLPKPLFIRVSGLFLFLFCRCLTGKNFTVVDKSKINLPHFFTVTDRLRTNEPRFTLNSPPFLMRFLTSRFPLFPQAARDIAGRRRNNNSGCIFKIYRTCYNKIPGCRNSRGYVNGAIPTDLSGIILLQYHKNI